MSGKSKQNKLSPEQKSALLEVLQTRFEANRQRHPGLRWETVQKKLDADPEKLWSLSEMERTEGEPDIVQLNREENEILFIDCSSESPKGRRSLCYDQAALDSRKQNKPGGSAIGLADEMGVNILTEADYRQLQTFGEFDIKTSSWVKTPEEIRDLGGAIFCDRRYDHVFMYHNGAESYYGARGFRSKLRV